MKINQQILVFDFDGVIANSIHDSFMTALNTYVWFVPNHTLPLKKPLKPDSVLPFEKAHSDIFVSFSQLMPLGNRAEDYFIIIWLIDTQEAGRVNSQADFDAYRTSMPSETLKAFHKRFYQTRSAIREQNPQAWLDLLPAFPGIVEAIKALSQRFLLTIATSKDRLSVNLQLNSYGLTDLFPPENILDKDFAKSKRAHLTRFHEEHKVPLQNIHFIDDKVLHLISVKDLGVHTYLALWGFNTQREQEMARKEGITLLQMDDLHRLGLGSQELNKHTPTHLSQQ